MIKPANSHIVTAYGRYLAGGQQAECNGARLRSKLKQATYCFKMYKGKRGNKRMEYLVLPKWVVGRCRFSGRAYRIHGTFWIQI